MNALAGCHTMQDVINTFRLSAELSDTHKIACIAQETQQSHDEDISRPSRTPRALLTQMNIHAIIH